jgi:pimeloyl-ACP methyl ester carboxylesterase
MPAGYSSGGLSGNTNIQQSFVCSRGIDIEDGPVLLVGHSYGGAVITEAGNDPKVAGLVYVSAFAPDKGESALGLVTSVPTSIGAEIRPDKNGFLLRSIRAEEIVPSL